MVSGGKKEPLWWGRGSSNCLALERNANGPYHKIYISQGGKHADEHRQDGISMSLMDFELRELGQFFIDVADGKPFENG